MSYNDILYRLEKLERENKELSASMALLVQSVFDVTLELRGAEKDILELTTKLVRMQSVE